MGKFQSAIVTYSYYTLCSHFFKIKSWLEVKISKFEIVTSSVCNRYCSFYNWYNDLLSLIYNKSSVNDCTECCPLANNRPICQWHVSKINWNTKKRSKNEEENQMVFWTRRGNS